MATQNIKTTPKGSGGRDEIEQIMDEIEQLQQEIDSAELSPAKPAPTPVSAPMTPTEAQNELEDLGFGTGDSESSLEETLANLKEEPSSGTGALDQMSTEDEEEVVEEEEEEPAEAGRSYEEEPIQEQATEVEPVAAMKNADQEQETPMTADSTHDTETTGTATDGSLTMTLKGSMTLKLQYDFDGQVVTVGFSDGALKVQLADGTEFKIPVRGRRGNALRRVA